MSSPSSAAAQARSRGSSAKPAVAKARPTVVAPIASGYDVVPTADERTAIEGWATASGVTPEQLVAEGFKQFAARVAAKYGEYRRRKHSFDAETVADIERSIP